MDEGLQGLLMGAVIVMFLIAMESALQVVDSSEALEQTVEERMMEQRTITVQRISEKERHVLGPMKYLEERLRFFLQQPCLWGCRFCT